MKSKSALYSKNLVLRDANEEDSAFILHLRTDPQKAKFLSATSASLEDQRAWMRAYKTKTDQAYFIIEDKKAEKLGCIRIYSPSGDAFEWGSWLIVDGAAPYVALESALVIYAYARKLGFKKAKIEVRQENTSVWKFHENIFGAVLVDQNEIDRFYEVSDTLIDEKLSKYKRLLASKSE